MNRFQWTAIGVCVFLNILDGFDVLVMAFTGSSVAAEWDLSGSQLGMLLSAGLVGMAIGAITLGPWADRIGRRKVILGCLVVNSVMMTLSAASQTAMQLGVLRVITGITIGGILASSNVIAAEYASRRWRGLAVSLNSSGYAIGATLGGLLSAVLIDSYGWRSVFLAGGVITAATIPVVLARLPESMDFLLSKQPARALERVNTLLARLGQPSISAIPSSDTAMPEKAGGRYRYLLTPGTRRPTIVLWSSFFLVMAGFYFVTSWTPSLLVDAGLSESDGITGGTVLNLGGIFGAAILGLCAARFALRNVLITYMLATAVLLAAFIASTSVLALAFTVGGVIGLFANGCIAGLYALAPTLYDPSIRATGVGTALAVGRIGAIVAPTAAGALLDFGLRPEQLYVGTGVIFVATAVILTVLPKLAGSTTDAPESEAAGSRR
ncbi:MFS transporter [Haloechinothrix aidingensis]|nr:MFS transporter [Haloechinothrix aidingensis]